MDMETLEEGVGWYGDFNRLGTSGRLVPVKGVERDSGHLPRWVGRSSSVCLVVRRLTI